MHRILVSLPGDRDRVGTLQLEDDDGVVMTGPFEVAGRADDAAARRHGNPRRDPLLPYGDTPLGRYRGVRVEGGNGHGASHSDQFGRHGVVILEPLAGDAALADAVGRFALLIQGGSPGPGGRLRTTNGSLRLSDRDQRDLLRALEPLGAVECHCVAGPAWDGALQVATETPCDDGDPPRAYVSMVQPALSSARREEDVNAALTASPDNFRSRFAPPVFHLMSTGGGGGGAGGSGGSGGSYGSGAIKVQVVGGGTSFFIDQNAKMPAITLQASITGLNPDPTPTTSFSFNIQLAFKASTCPHGPANKTIRMPTINQTVVGGQLLIPFTAVRGGQLTVKVQATVAGQPLHAAQLTGVTIGGTNPPIATIQAALPHDTLRRIARRESGYQQFSASPGGGVSNCPSYSQDNKGGVGIFQLTNPPPTDDQVWIWTQNVAGGIRHFNSLQGVAQHYPGQVRGSAVFKNMVNAFNQARTAQGLHAIPVDLPDFTSGDFNTNLQQLQLDMIRGFNGYGGSDAFGFHLHEFRVVLDAAGKLVITVNAAGTRGTASWERVPASARPQAFGDPDYVNHVLAATP